MASKQLTDKQALFCKEYLIDLNATQAAIRAGYSEKTAYSIGSENLSKPEIQEYINKLQEKRNKRVEINADYVLAVIQETLENSRADDDRNNTYKGAELLGKHLKLFTDKTEIAHSGEVSLKNILDDIDGQSTGLPTPAK